MYEDERLTEGNGLSASWGSRPSSNSTGIKLLIHANDVETGVIPLIQKHYEIQKSLKISNIEDIASIISSYSIIESLVIYTHGIPGSLMINGNDIEFENIEKKLIRSKKIQIENIYLEGCNVLEEGGVKGAIVLGNRVNAKTISGFNYAHIFQRVSPIVPNKFVNFKFFQPYFAFNQAIDPALSKGLTIWFEWFYTETESPKIIKSTNDVYKKMEIYEELGKKRMFKSRQDAKVRNIKAEFHKDNSHAELQGFEQIKISFD